MAGLLSKLFKKKIVETELDQTIQTTPLVEDQISQISSQPSEKFRPAQFIVGCGQSVGMQRNHNEDALFTLESVLSDGLGEKAFGLFIIADGMGGHKNGEVASGVSTRAVARHLLNKVYGHFLDYQNEPVEESIQEILEQAVKETQKAVIHYAPGGGTTLTIALVLGEQVTIAHVGDSRAYFVFPDGRLQKVTKDHSLVQRMVDLEEITEDEAFIHPQKNVLLRAVGQPEPYRADIQTHHVPHDGKLVLCSDGLWGAVPETELVRIFSKPKDPVSTCNKLIAAANNAGGPDNISVIIVEFIGA